MNQEKISALTDQELLAEAKKIKSTKILDAIIVGVLIGVATYSTVKNGLGFFTFVPLFFVVILYKNGEKSKALNKEIAQRNLL